MTEVTTMEFGLRYKVIGKTVIHHKLRLDMKLSLDEYVLLDFIHTHNQGSNAAIYFTDYYRETGFIKEDIQSMFKSMKERNLLFFNKEQNRVDVCKEWKDNFSSHGFIDKLWRIHPKGNKTTARQRLPKVLKIISIELLIEKLKAYLKHCDQNEIFKKGLDVWLNPEKSHWDDPLVGHNIKPKQITKTQIKFK